MSTRFTEEEMRQRFERGSRKYRGFTIVAKRDYVNVLAYSEGFYLRDGFVVTSGPLTNAMPGATWFTTVEAAREAIDILLAVGNEKFWETMAAVKKAKADALRAIIGEIPSEA